MSPFEIVSAELMDPKSVADEFVEEYTENTKISSHAHTIVWGSRGSGKSMHFKYLEPLAQAWCPKLNYKGDVKRFILNKDSYVGVYINCREGILNREELKILSSQPEIDEVFLHLIFSRYLSSVILFKLTNTFLEQLKWILNISIDWRSLPRWLQKSIKKNTKSIKSLLKELNSKCVEWIAEINDIIDGLFLSENISDVKKKFPSECPRLTSDLIDFCVYVQKKTNIEVPFFLLFDEANELADIHQYCVNSLIALRSQKHICIKVASQRNGFIIGRTLTGDVDETHDFTTLDIDALYTNNREAYYKRILQIGNYRLTRAGINDSVKNYLPPSQKEIEELEKAKKIAEERYNSIPIKKRPLDKNNYVKKYAPSILFQDILSSKAIKTYAGFDNLVHLSSGIIRSFLDCTSKMYSKYQEKYPGKKPQYIPISIQAEVIKEYSDEFIQTQILDKMKSIDPNSKEMANLQKLHNLLNGLGAFFRRRLLDKESSEPRIISISLKDLPDSHLQEILDLAEQEAFFHTKWYISKRGNRKLKCYVLNRRLCPHFNLDLTGFQGRIEIDSRTLETCLTDPNTFVKIMSVKHLKKVDNQIQLEIFNW